MPRETSPTPSDEAGRPSKRKRIALACVPCRDRKVRCDGQKPVCGPCTKKGEPPAGCTYAVLSNSAKRLSEQEYIACLQRQVKELRQASGLRNQEVGGTRPDGGRSCLELPSNEACSPESRRTTGQTPEFDVSGQYQWATGRDSGEEGGHSGAARQAPPGPSSDGRAASETTASVEAIQVPGNLLEISQEHSQTSCWQENRPAYNKPDEPSPISAMGATVSVQGQPSIPRTDGFYGQSSVLSLLQQVSQPSLHQGGPDTEAGQPQTSTMPSMSSDSRGLNGGQMSVMLDPRYALPPREIADKLVALYFSSVNIFYPWVHSPSFWREYESIWTGHRQQSPTTRVELDITLGSSRCERPVFFCALNAMFALGCQFSDLTPTDKEAGSSMFYERMKALLHFELLDTGSVSHVQALLLVAQYLLCTQYPPRCWNVVGLACRMAIGLGLQSLHQRLPNIESEIRKRIWYGCVQMDMTVSMTLGRPPSMRMPNDVPLPSAIDDEWLTSDRTPLRQPEGVTSINSFNVENIKLANILGNILDSIYHPAPKEKQLSANHYTIAPMTHADFGIIADLDSQLDDIANALPAELQWSGPRTIEPQGELSGVLKRQSNVLHARFLHLKVLLYRPSFTGYCALEHPKPSWRPHEVSSEQAPSRMQDSEFAKSLRIPCAVACVKATCELVRSVEMATMEDATGAWWFSLLCKHPPPLTRTRAEELAHLTDSYYNQTLSPLVSSSR